ncbi:outer membrane beta-barrel protein [Luteolibacter flavescens]|uniref:Outer membrane beta-barrel protein n=1 Tax=Luteolibacter flavescens TaxID=1859460 RepID=A0ABT3FMU8_9BACT|nr:outer membrane beta-barrel protein [Luteolibacter flavescens]MCW1884897.1 outer membrane beta-barrel protein [Luteolibacter flavescens]
MKRSLYSAFAVASTLGAAQASLYYIPDESQDSIPLTWSVGLNFTWDDNVNPTSAIGEDEAMSVNPFVGLSFVSISPQTTWDVYARIGAIYYFDEPDALGSEDFYTQARVGVNLTHRVSERLRFSSRNFVSYELEPDYSYGFATTRQSGEYLYWSTDNSVGFRWTERLATYTGFTLTGLDYDEDVSSQDRFTWTLYNQFRYQLTPQTVLTAEYRYSQMDGDDLASDSEEHYLLGGVEHRLSPNTIFIGRVGAQFRETDGPAGSDNTSPYVEATVRSNVNEQFTVRGFARYGIEGYDTVRAVGLGFYEFGDRQTFRLGISGDYAVSQALSFFGGLDYIPASFDDGRLVSGFGPAGVGSLDEDVWNAYVGVSYKFTEMLYGTLSYNYTDTDSDFANQSYDRNRVSVGVRAEF